MEFLTQIFDTIYENFFDPRKRVFVGYLFSAIVIAFLWLCVVKKKTLKECFYNIFDKKIFFSKSAKADYILFLFNIIILMFLSPILITQLAIASVIFESLHFQTYLVPINTDIKYLWLVPYFFTSLRKMVSSEVVLLFQKIKILIKRIAKEWYFHYQLKLEKNGQ